ncbi:MAG: hypothetical protein RIE53_11855 [Rhodothermales bacterium]
MDAFFEEFIRLFFPDVYPEIDWEASIRSRDKELSKLRPESETGTRFVDKLVEVRLRGGGDVLVIVHIEVQSQRDNSFSERMWTYYRRLVDRYGQHVVSLALLADEQMGWRPRVFETGMWGCSVRFDFPVAKLMDFRECQDELATSDSPFALLLLAIFKAQDLAGDSPGIVLERSRWKLQTFRSLYERGWSPTRIRQLFRFLDWIVRLPEDVDDQLHVELAKTEEGKQMTYITSFERYGMRKGMETGMEKGRLENAKESIVDALEVRFGAVTPEIRTRIGQLTDVDTCKVLLKAAVLTPSLAAFSREFESD